MEQLSEKLFDFLKGIPKGYYLPLALFMAGLICLCIGLIQLSNSHKKDISQDMSHPDIQSSPSALLQSFGMEVDVEGAVVNPGVYKLPPNGRVQDALISAGGMSANADRDTIAKSINLAAKLVDGVKIYIPKIGEGQPPAVLGASVGTASPANQGQATSLININTATGEQLDNLPGIGPVTAQKIIAARPFSSTDDLLAKKAVTNSVFQKIKDLITIY